MLSISCPGTKLKIKAHPHTVMEGLLPSQSREAAFQTQPQTSFTWMGRWSRGVKGGIELGLLEPKGELPGVGVYLPLLSELELGRVTAQTNANGRWVGGAQPLCLNEA